MAPSTEDAALRAATTPAQREKALSAALDRLAATHSVPETERLLNALLSPPASLDSVLSRLQPVASVCTAPPRKAACVGHALVRRLALYVATHPGALQMSRETLLRVYQANPAIAVGVFSALESSTTNALAVAQPLLIALLIDASSQRAVPKLALIQTLVRVAWSSETADQDRQTHIAHVLVRAVALSPLSTNVDAWTVYPALVASAVDLLADPNTNQEDLRSVAHATLRRVFFGLEHDLDVVSLLQSFVELVTAWPRVLCSSSIVCQLAAVLLHTQSAAREQALVLRILRVLLPAVESTPRTVYVEALLAPLVVVQAAHSTDASVLLQQVLDTVSATPFQCEKSAPIEPSGGVEAAHAASFLALVSSVQACEGWLESLFHEKNEEMKDSSSTLLIELSACLIDRRGRVRMLVLEALERQLQLRRVHKNADWPSSNVKLLVSTLVVLTSYRPASASPTDALCLSKSFQVLASLAATTTETMKIILRLIKRMTSSAMNLLPQALHLMLLVWKQDSRVYPQLENLLNQAKDAGDAQDENASDDAEIVRMATILAMCEKDPEAGVEWIAEIQAFLEHDAVSVVAMAVRAVTLLCIADCLDYETTVKIFVVKMKKNKISCADEALFQQELCKFYAFGGSCDFAESSPKYSARVLSDLWEYAEADDAEVRLEAFVALNCYTLEVLGLHLVDSNARATTDDDEEDEEELTAQEVEENVDRVWGYLQTEEDEQVRGEIESLVKKILDTECKKLAPGGAGRTGTGVASAASFAALEQRVSAAATKELKKQLPIRQTLVDQVDQAAQWCAYLLAYEPANVVESGGAAKRKDKRLRVVMSQVDDMKSVLDRCLASSTATDASKTKDPVLYQFLGVLQAVDAWNSFARKYFGRLEELAVLRTPMDAPDGHTAGVLSNLIDEQITSLVDESTSHKQSWLVVGAIMHQASLSASSGLLEATIVKFRALLRAQFQQAMEELRVFKDAGHAIDVQYLLLGLVLAYPTEWDPVLGAIFTRVLPVVSNDGSHYLMRAAAVLFASHVSSLYRAEEARSEQQQRLQVGIECVVTAILQPTCGASAGGIATKVLGGSLNMSYVTDLLKNSSKSDENIVVAWAAAMGLAQLSHRLGAVHRLGWLDNLRVLLETVWTDDSTLFVAIALGPILLESVHHNRIALSTIPTFVSRLQQEQYKAPGEVVVVGTLALPYLMQRVGIYGYASARDDIENFLQSLESGCDGSSAPILTVAAGNLLYGSTGITLFGATTVAECEVTVDMTTVQQITTTLSRYQQEAQPALSTAAAFVMAAIADRAESFVVVQKNKTFDAQINTLPTTSLMFKVLEFLRVGSADTIDSEAVKRASQSGLKCVAHASRSSPLPFDFSALVLRVMSRYAHADDVLMASIDLAASHASGVSLLMSNALSPQRLVNYSPSVVEVCVNAVATSRGRLTAEQLKTLLSRSFDVLVECWHRADSSSIVSAAFAEWITFVGSLVQTVAPKEGEVSRDSEVESVGPTVSALVLKEFVMKLPFSPRDDASKTLLHHLARDVLSKIENQSSVTDAVVASTTQLGDKWSWWRAGSLLSALLRLGSISSSSVIFRWILQLDFSSIESSSVVDTLTSDVVDAVSIAAKKRSLLEVNEPWLLELLDAVSSTTAHSPDAVFKRRVLFALVETVLSWKEVRGHELLILRGGAATPRKDITASFPVQVAQAILRHHHERSNASASLAERLWRLQTNDEAIGDVRDAIVRELYVIASDAKLRLLSNDTEKGLAAQLSVA